MAAVSAMAAVLACMSLHWGMKALEAVVEDYFASQKCDWY